MYWRLTKERTYIFEQYIVIYFRKRAAIDVIYFENFNESDSEFALS